MIVQMLTTDVLIIGGGAAGLRAAIAAREAGVNVLVVSKTPAGYANNTAVAGGRIAAAVEPSDSPAIHAEDTWAAGRRINHRGLVSVLAEEAPRRVPELPRFGVPLRQQEGSLLATLSPGHSHPRVLALDGGMGYTMSRAMRDFALRIGVRLVDGVLASDLLKSGGRVCGIVGLDRRGQPLAVQARAVVLAGGGAGQAFARTNNPAAMTGDGYGIAYRAGLTFRDMEFVQFYPTVLAESGLPTVTVFYERLLAGQGGCLRNGQGEDVLARHSLLDPRQATRDALARAMAVEITEGRGKDGALIFDVSRVPVETVRANLRALAPALQTRKTYMVAPAVHFLMGGVEIDEQCQTAIEGLFAAGEVTGGVHGANRLASNALAETVVFGARAGENAARYALGSGQAQWPQEEADRVAAARLGGQVRQSDSQGIAEARHHCQEVIWLAAGPVRTEVGLQAGLAELREISKTVAAGERIGGREALELENLLIVGEMVIRSALLRKESRGAHYRADFPAEGNPADWETSIRSKRGDVGMETWLPRPFRPFETAR